MDQISPGRRLRVLIFSYEDNPALEPLRHFLLSKGCPIRITFAVEEVIDIARKPDMNYGMVIILSPVSDKIFKELKSDKFVLLEYGPGRCSIRDLFKKIDIETKNYGKY
ncbi:hypothetical protein A2572_04220 [Candidatus Collierbacteria bacterium RIFOXYD1_FULL_40_9]|uniref:Uncharacterized protein n=1 Tax=Candidatus Collierbacteria bacterium RIFOXYD1_FULL_40_9 TaxID=1817731 RepID=A0A1F5FPT7_9BACT|nr:MAG: hypothetical protein A2572_04220 [Candidatus Collierbacteria bacterium RIFOXYD1_FULL_40_9]